MKMILTFPRGNSDLFVVLVSRRGKWKASEARNNNSEELAYLSCEKGVELRTNEDEESCGCGSTRHIRDSSYKASQSLMWRFI